MNEKQPNKTIETSNELLEEFETTVAEKNKIIANKTKEAEAAIKARMRLETELDNEKMAKQAALDRAERAEARYLRNTEIKARAEKEEQNLLEVLFN